MPFPGQQHDEPLPNSALYDQYKQWSDPQAHAVQRRLNKNLGPEFVSHRPAPGGARVTYLEGWKAINLANDTFGFNGWSSEIRSMTVDYCDELAGGRLSVGVSCTVRVTLKDGSYHEDVGFGHIENAKSKYMAFDKCKKEATTDGVKRTLRKFGNVLGNCLYNPSYSKQVMRVKPEQYVMDKDDLVRSMDFQDEYHGKFTYGRGIEPPPMRQMMTKPAQPEPPQKAIGPPSYVHRQGNSEVPKHEPGSLSRSESTMGPILDPDSIYKLVEDASTAHDEFYDELDFSDDQSGFEDTVAVVPEKKPEPPTAAVPPAPLESKGETSTPPTTIPNPNDVPPQTTTSDPGPAPNTPIKFFKASVATAIQQNSPVSSEHQFDPAFQSPSIRRTLNHNKSVPIKRSEVLGMAQSQESKSPVAAAAGAAGAAAAPSRNGPAAIQSPVRSYGAPRRAVGHPLGRSHLAAGRSPSPGPNATTTTTTTTTSTIDGGPTPGSLKKRPMADLGPSVPNIPVSANNHASVGAKTAVTVVDTPADKKQKV